MSDFKEKYEKKIRPELMKKRGFASPLAVPRIVKIAVNSGIGRVTDQKAQDEIQRQLALITGQKPSPRPAKKSIASFKTREGMIIGFSVTLRGKKMYNFLSRLLEVALPRTRDFRGLAPSSLDEAGNLTIGIREHIVFPEIIGEDVKTIFGLEITIVTNAPSREAALELYQALGFPFTKTA
ncbi:50S ribosomal protein L5 [Candidatus Giovannonibacteria bacterium]|nr:50S ribosomal protein L5 [Candidatus Giovannonibacteria bacterium]